MSSIRCHYDILILNKIEHLIWLLCDDVFLGSQLWKLNIKRVGVRNLKKILFKVLEDKFIV